MKYFVKGFAMGFSPQPARMPSKLGKGMAHPPREGADPVKQAKIRADVEEEDVVFHRVLKIATDPDGIPWEDYIQQTSFPIVKMDLGKDTGKVRRITNAKAPTPCTGVSVNDLLSAGWSTVDVPRTREFVIMIDEAGISATLLKEDIWAAFRLMPIRLLDLPFMVFRCGNEHFLDTIMTFGMKSAPRIFNVFADVIMYILHKHGVERGKHFFDDHVFAFPAK
jgi:hypothetical protein